jgi:small subunit ribosomal protein S15
MLTKRVKSNIMKDVQKHDKDTGSAEVQIGLLTRRMGELADHLKKNPKDNHSRRGLLKMVSQRRRLLTYLKTNDEKVYAKVQKKFDLK